MIQLARILGEGRFILGVVDGIKGQTDIVLRRCGTLNPAGDEVLDEIPVAHRFLSP